MHSTHKQLYTRDNYFSLNFTRSIIKIFMFNILNYLIYIYDISCDIINENNILQGGIYVEK